jgi:ADP-ribosylglycohydrolase
MRSGIIGAFYREDPELRADFVAASTLLTHTDPKALIGALAVAELVADRIADAGQALPILRQVGARDEDWLALVDRIETCLGADKGVLEFAAAIGCEDGVGGYVYETVPLAIYAWLYHCGDGGKAVSAALDCGGDADTVGAITGALCGASNGVESFPGDWLDNLCDWPRGAAFLERLAACPARVPKVSWIFLVLRNLLFLAVVLGHGILRYLPGGLRLLRRAD